MKISVVINTYNAAQFLEKVLHSVKEFDEIVVCDMHSTDDTLNIVSRYNCKLVYHEHTGIVEPARAYAIAQATNEWVLVVDADEVVPVALRDYLYSIRPQQSDFAALRIPRKNYFMGRFMHCVYPDYLLRFFKKNSIQWPSTVHARPKVDGNVINIPKKRKDLAFVHLANESVNVITDKMNRYTSFEVDRRKDKKYTVLSLIAEPLVRFLRFYVFKAGFRDGLPGFLWACMYSYYKFITIAKVMEFKVTKESYDKDLMQ